MPAPLTAKQREVFDWVVAYLRQKGYPPTLREICRGFGVSCPNGAGCHVRALVRKGWIERDKNVVRGLRVVAPDLRVVG